MPPPWRPQPSLRDSESFAGVPRTSLRFVLGYSQSSATRTETPSEVLPLEWRFRLEFSPRHCEERVRERRGNLVPVECAETLPETRLLRRGLLAMTSWDATTPEDGTSTPVCPLTPIPYFLSGFNVCIFAPTSFRYAAKSSRSSLTFSGISAARSFFSLRSSARLYSSIRGGS
jgi:hypothetical protein